MLQLLKPTRLEPVLHNKRSHHSERPVHCNEEQPPLAATRESPHVATKTQRSQKRKTERNLFKKKKKKKKEKEEEMIFLFFFQVPVENVLSGKLWKWPSQQPKGQLSWDGHGERT